MSDQTGNIAIENNSQQIGISLRVKKGSHMFRKADYADRLTTKRKIRLEGGVSGEGMFDGSEDVMIYTTVDDSILTDRDEMSNEDIDDIIRNTDRLIDP